LLAHLEKVDEVRGGMEGEQKGYCQRCGGGHGCGIGIGIVVSVSMEVVLPQQVLQNVQEVRQKGRGGQGEERNSRTNQRLKKCLETGG